MNAKLNFRSIFPTETAININQINREAKAKEHGRQMKNLIAILLSLAHRHEENVCGHWVHR